MILVFSSEGEGIVIFLVIGHVCEDEIAFVGLGRLL